MLMGKGLFFNQARKLFRTDNRSKRRKPAIKELTNSLRQPKGGGGDVNKEMWTSFIFEPSLRR